VRLITTSERAAIRHAKEGRVLRWLAILRVSRMEMDNGRASLRRGNGLVFDLPGADGEIRRHYWGCEYCRSRRR
jgi:hypothetical protein